jgi:hypothetical protein
MASATNISRRRNDIFKYERGSRPEKHRPTIFHNPPIDTEKCSLSSDYEDDDFDKCSIFSESDNDDDDDDDDDEDNYDLCALPQSQMLTIVKPTKTQLQPPNPIRDLIAKKSQTKEKPRYTLASNWKGVCGAYFPGFKTEPKMRGNGRWDEDTHDLGAGDVIMN